MSLSSRFVVAVGLFTASVAIALAAQSATGPSAAGTSASDTVRPPTASTQDLSWG
ncbi:hypothetical protein ABZ953_16745 [Streptomyces sp. NPDC046465]|uniref:hypothetical protein n=1 Tax=Streptomyces sp. NPDC046465 TaxID=3155810 RepID=UPI003402482E